MKKMKIFALQLNETCSIHLINCNEPFRVFVVGFFFGFFVRVICFEQPYLKEKVARE